MQSSGFEFDWAPNIGPVDSWRRNKINHAVVMFCRECLRKRMGYKISDMLIRSADQVSTEETRPHIVVDFEEASGTVTTAYVYVDENLDYLGERLFQPRPSLKVQRRPYRNDSCSDTPDSLYFEDRRAERRVTKPPAAHLRRYSSRTSRQGYKSSREMRYPSEKSGSAIGTVAAVGVAAAAAAAGYAVVDYSHKGEFCDDSCCGFYDDDHCSMCC